VSDGRRVFDPAAAAADRESFIGWFDAQTQGSEGHGYEVPSARADVTLGRIANYSGDDGMFWCKTLPVTELAKRLRDVGKSVRGWS
jgi:hypothetical protein